MNMARAPNGTASGPGGGVPVLDPRNFTYASALTTPAATLQELTMRQLREDITAYKYDLDFCNHQLNDPSIDLTPPEMRTFQIRVLDLGHQIRHCQHKMETLQFEITTSAASASMASAAGLTGAGGFSAANNNSSRSSMSVGTTMQHQHQQTPHNSQQQPRQPQKRRARVKHEVGEQDPAGSGSPQEGLKRQRRSELTEESDGAAHTTLQRLGFWKCRLCTSEKYLTCGPGRQPGQPCKWPLRDVAKMIAHYMELHTEHTPSERCEELGHALDRNRGPFEYWLRRSHSVDIGDGAIISQCVHGLQSGQVPQVLRKISRAASAFPEEWEQ